MPCRPNSRPQATHTREAHSAAAACRGLLRFPLHLSPYAARARARVSPRQRGWGRAGRRRIQNVRGERRWRALHAADLARHRRAPDRAASEQVRESRLPWQQRALCGVVREVPAADGCGGSFAFAEKVASCPRVLRLLSFTDGWRSRLALCSSSPARKRCYGGRLSRGDCHGVHQLRGCVTNRAYSRFDLAIRGAHGEGLNFCCLLAMISLL